MARVFITGSSDGLGLMAAMVMGEALCNWIGWPLAAGARS
jgi:hypothetical protein